MSEKDFCKGCARRHDSGEPRHYHDMHAESRSLADINDKLIINLRDLGHMMRFLYEGKASQKRILIILSESEMITQRNLTERLGIQPGSASEILSKLEGAELIIRTPNETDRRTMNVCLTDIGRKRAAEALAQRKKRHEEMFSCLSEEEKLELLSLLERVCADWRTRYSENGNARKRARYHHERHEAPHGYGGR